MSKGGVYSDKENSIYH